MSLYQVLGQKNIAEMLVRSIEHNRITHAYIFAGPKGVGKSKMAVEYAKALNCSSNHYDACDHCQNCKKIEHHNHPDVIWVRPNGNSIKIDQIRQIQKDFNYKATESKFKVFIIEQSELMTKQAANSLLKFLEEPQSPRVAILLTENQYQLLSTIRSRCQTITFSHLDPQNIVQILEKEGYRESEILPASNITKDIEEVRNLLSSDEFAQMRNIMIQWSEGIYSKKYQILFSINDKIMKNDYNKEHLPQFLDLLIMWYRDILNIKLNRKAFILYKEHENILNKQALHVTEDQLVNYIETILQTQKQLSSHVNLQLALENLVISLWEG